MICQIYPTELKLSKTNSLDTEAPFLDLSIAKSIISFKRDLLHFGIVNFLFHGVDVTNSPSHGVFVLQLTRFAIVCTNVDDQCLTAKLIKQGY